MNAKEARRLASRILRSIRMGFPELYNIHIKGRRDAFVMENTPQVYTGKGEVLGYINKDLRVLFALVTILEAKQDSTDKPPEHISDALAMCENVRELALSGIIHLCTLGFWTPVLQRFGKHTHGGKHALYINENWAIVLANRTDETGSILYDILSATEMACATIKQAGHAIDLINLGQALPKLERQQSKTVYHHNDPPCNARLDEDGHCPSCRLSPDTQSVVLRHYCPECDVLLNVEECPKCGVAYSLP